MRISSLLTLALLVSPFVAHAGEGHDPLAVVQHIFDVSDQNRDGKLDQTEYDAAGLPGFGVSFDETDANGDGEASLEEYLDLYIRHHPGDEQGV